MPKKINNSQRQQKSEVVRSSSKRIQKSIDALNRQYISPIVKSLAADISTSTKATSYAEAEITRIEEQLTLIREQFERDRENYHTFIEKCGSFKIKKVYGTSRSGPKKGVSLHP